MAPLQPDQVHFTPSTADVHGHTVSDQLSPANAEQAVYDVLLTGFGPFHNVKINPSWQLLKPLQGSTYPTPRGKRVRCECIEVKVSYDTVLHVVPSIHGLPPSATTAVPSPPSQQVLANHTPNRRHALVVHVGVAQNRHFVSLEQRARFAGYKQPDVDGEYAPFVVGPQGQRLQGLVHPPLYINDGSGEMTTPIPLERIIQRLSAPLQADMRISNDAGLFLCEFTYCTSLASAKLASQNSGGQPTPVLFVHVPDTDQPYSLDQLTAIIQAITAEVIDSIY